MYSAGGNAVLPALGFPIRESADQWLFSAYPRLFAAVHALLRLLVPRHPPCALLILTVIRHYSDPKVLEAPGDTRLFGSDRRDRCQLALVVQFSRSAKRCPLARNGPPTTGARRLEAGLSKLNSMHPLGQCGRRSGSHCTRPRGRGWPRGPAGTRSGRRSGSRATRAPRYATDGRIDRSIPGAP